MGLEHALLAAVGGLTTALVVLWKIQHAAHQQCERRVETLLERVLALELLSGERPMPFGPPRDPGSRGT